jgi:hypothetical protein
MDVKVRLLMLAIVAIVGLFLLFIGGETCSQ